MGELGIELGLGQEAVLLDRHVAGAVDRHRVRADRAADRLDLDRAAPIVAGRALAHEEAPQLIAARLHFVLLADHAVLVAPDFAPELVRGGEERFLGAAVAVGGVGRRAAGELFGGGGGAHEKGERDEGGGKARHGSGPQSAWPSVAE